MKKIYRVFVVFTVLLTGFVLAAAVFLSGISGILSAAVAVLGAAIWAAAFLRFKSVEYLDDGERFSIRRGVFFHAETSLKKSAILYVTTVKLGSMTLFSVLHTASGRVFVFAEIPSKSRSNAEF